MSSFWNWLKKLFGWGSSNNDIDIPDAGEYIYGTDGSYSKNPDYVSPSESSSRGFWGSFTDVLNALVNRLTGAALTPAEREASALQLSNQQTLNEEDYQRKIDFYERYESPAAMMQQYKAAGLNPALMYQGAPSVSASGGVGSGSAGMPSAGMESVAGLISAISGASIQSHKMRFEQEIKRKELELQEEQLGIQRNQSEAYARFLASQSIGQDITNQNLQRMFDLNAENVFAKTASLVDSLKTAEAQRVLLKAQVSESAARSALMRTNNAIAQCDLKVRNEYNSILVRTSQLQYDMLSAEGEYQRRFLEQGIKKGEEELTHLLIENGLLGLEKDNYKSNLNWEHGLGVARTVITGAGAALGAVVGMKTFRAQPSMIQGPTSFNDYLKYGQPIDSPFRPPVQIYGSR